MKEVEKMVAVQEKSKLLSQFIDWLEEEGFSICRWQNVTRYSPDLGDYSPAGYLPKRKSNEHLLADFFGIDLEKVEEERLEILNSLKCEAEAKS